MATSIISLYGSAKANYSVFLEHFVGIRESSPSNGMQVAMVMASQLVMMYVFQYYVTILAHDQVVESLL